LAATLIFFENFFLIFPEKKMTTQSRVCH